MQRVDFCDPFTTGVNEVLVTDLRHPPVNAISDLSGKELHVRKSSSYHESLKQVNRTLSAAATATTFPQLAAGGVRNVVDISQSCIMRLLLSWDFRFQHSLQLRNIPRTFR